MIQNRVLAVAERSDRRAFDTVPLLEGRTQIDGRPTAYVCERFTCSLPVTDPDDLRDQLDRGVG